MTAANRSTWSVGVIVPARDEAGTVVSCIESIVAASAYAAVSRPWIVIVADSCTDSTAHCAREALAGHGEVLLCQAGSAGAARRLGVAAALRHFKDVSADRLWLANTDADTVVTREWLAVQLQLADQGMTGVAGIVHLDSSSHETAHAVHTATYLTNENGTHGHVHGANLAMRADAYLDAGGWSTAGLAEDHCLWGRLRNRGWRVSSPVESVVITSGRLRGRAAGGFADTLKAKIAGRCVTA